MNYFVLLFTLFLYLFDHICYVNCGTNDGKKRFDLKNLTDADCIDREDNIYLGKKSTANDKTKCETWKNVTNYHLDMFKGHYQFFFADEYMDHNYCRNIPLDAYQRDGKFNNATAHTFVQTNGWKHGPWCYIKVSPENEHLLWGKKKTQYAPMPCFEQCSDEKVTTTIPPPPLKEEDCSKTKFMYNNQLINNLAQNLFSNFDHGDSKYYESKPSDKNVSTEFESNAKIIFYAGMSLLIITVSAIFAKHYFLKWRKRPKNVKKESKEQEKEELVENDNNNNGQNEREIKEAAAELPNVSNENLNVPGTAELPKKSNENLNLPETKAVVEVPKVTMLDEKPAAARLPQKRKLRKR
uniref:Kringle domain-containing protein n=1 Tax=Panagrolaimus sp. PS1159 TaxID=55785 RepID=A0AC35FU00_9BILA